MSEEILTRWQDTTIAEQQKEIERLNKCIKDDKENADEIIVEQQREIERLNNNINKATKYIEEHIYKYYDTQFNEYVEETEFESNTQPNVLLDILKGEDKEC